MFEDRCSIRCSFVLQNRMAVVSDRKTWLDGVLGLSLGASQAAPENRDKEDRLCAIREKMASKNWKHDWVTSAYGPGVNSRRDEKMSALCILEGDLAEFIDVTTAGPIMIYFAWYDTGNLDQRTYNWTDCGDKIGFIRSVPEQINGANTRLAKAMNYLKPFAEKFPSVTWADLIQMASDVAVEVMGGPEIEMKYGRVAATGTEAYVDVASRMGFVGDAGLQGVVPPLGSGATEQAQHLRNALDRKMCVIDQVVVAFSVTHTVGCGFKDRSDTCLVRCTNLTQFIISEVSVRQDEISGISTKGCNTCQNPALIQTGPDSSHIFIHQWRRIPEQQSNLLFVDTVGKNEVNDDVLDENNLKIYVKTINKKTISIYYRDSMKAAVLLEEVERRTEIPKDMTRLTHKGKDINEKKSMKENNICTNETIEMSMRLLGGMEANEQMDTRETDEDREKKRKLDEGKEGKAAKPNEDITHLKNDIMEALKKTDEKMECYSRKNEEKMVEYSKKADDLMERFMIMTNSVGTQIQCMNSSIVKLHETNEKMKEDGDNKFNKIDERFKDMEKRMMDLDMKQNNRSDDERNRNVTANQGETVIAGLHKETTESEVTDMLKEIMREIGMDYGKVKLVCPAKPITHAFVYFENDSESNKFIRSANMLKKELRGRKIRITRSMEAEERFYNKRIGYVKSCINKKHDVPLHSIALNWNTKHVTIKGQIVAKTCQDGSLKFNKYQDVEDEVDDLMQKWQTKNSS